MTRRGLTGLHSSGSAQEQQEARMLLHSSSRGRLGENASPQL